MARTRKTLPHLRPTKFVAFGGRNAHNFSLRLFILLMLFDYFGDAVSGGDGAVCQRADYLLGHSDMIGRLLRQKLRGLVLWHVHRRQHKVIPLRMYLLFLFYRLTQCVNHLHLVDLALQLCEPFENPCLEFFQI